MELSTQLYIISGVLAGAIFILLLMVIALIIRLQREVKERKANEMRYLTNADPAIRKGEEMDKRGYSMYRGVPGQPAVPQRTSSLVQELRDYQREPPHTHRPPYSTGGYQGRDSRDHRRH